MTAVPVLWVSRHFDDGVMCRGDKADQAMLEAMLDGSLWHVPGGYTFEHHEAPASAHSGTYSTPKWRTIIAPHKGAVVVIPARDHEGDESWLVERLNTLEWSLVMLTSEEEWGFEWDRLQAEDRKLWVWQARPEHDNLAGHMPCGWYPGTREGLRGDWRFTNDDVPPYVVKAPEDRPVDWMFAGQVTHERRQACFGVLSRLRKRNRGRVVLEATEGYLQEAIPRDQYLELMARTKVVPCPSGPKSLCTARVEEALEAGCVPVLDLVKPEDPQFDYWRMIWPDHPLPTITEWSDYPEVLDKLLDEWPAPANRAWAWWQQWKRRQTWTLHDNITQLRGAQPENSWTYRQGTTVDYTFPSNEITVIIPTSPTERHPSTDHIEEVVASVRAQLPGAEIIITADGVRPEQEKLRGAYEAYLHRLLWLANFAWRNAVPLVADEFQHQALTTKAALDLVRTPLVLFVEHDTPLVGPIDWPKVTDLVASGEVNCLRFHEDVAIHPDHEHLYLGERTIKRGVPIRKTWAWYARPSLSTTRFWRERIMPHFPSDESPADDEWSRPRCRTFIEDPLYGYILNERLAHGDAAWWDWRLAVYAPGEMTDPPLGFKRSGHLNSRGSESKYDIWGFRA